MSSPWHAEVYGRAVKQMSREAEGKRTAGWLEWFRKNHPEKHAKMSAAIERIEQLWGKADSASMEEFKKSVKMEVDATRWAVEKFNEEAKAA